MRLFSLILSVLIILLGLLNIEYGQFFDWSTNGRAFLNLTIGLLLLVFYLKKSSGKAKG